MLLPSHKFNMTNADLTLKYVHTFEMYISRVKIDTEEYMKHIAICLSVEFCLSLG